jgi:hypothetical protein
MFHASCAPYKGFSGPIGSGKSQALCQEALRLAFLNPGRMGLIGAPTYAMLRDATQRALFEILEASNIPFDYNKGENTLTLKENKSKIVFRSLDEYERLRGTNLAWFAVDELTYTQEEAWLRLEGRLRDPKAKRLCGCAAWTPKGFDWVYRRFIADSPEAYHVIIAKPDENKHLLKAAPDFYLRLKNSYDDKFYRQEVLGEYLNMSGGKVYANFSRDLHLGDFKPDPSLHLLWTLDFNVDPMSSLIVQIVNGVAIVYDEIVLRGATTDQAAEEFLRRYPNHRTGVVVYGDASGSARQTTGFSDYEMVKSYFMANSRVVVHYRPQRSNPPVRDRINLVNLKLRDASGQVALRVDRRCTELVKDFEQVAFKSDSSLIDKDRDRSRTHLSDALGYLLWQEFTKPPKIGERSERLCF